MPTFDKTEIGVDPNMELAAHIWAEIRTKTESPMDGVAVLCLVIYRFWMDCNSAREYPLDEFLKDTVETVKNFNLIQDVQGNA